MDVRITTDNNTSTSMNENKTKIIPKVSVETTTLGINCQSSSPIATQNSLQICNQLLKLPNYQELILIMDHVTPNDIPYILLSQMKMNTFTHRQQYLVGRK